MKLWLDRLSDNQNIVINLQVLNELTNVLLRKKWFESVEAVYAVVDSLSTLGSSPLMSDTTAISRRVHLRYRYSWWDCLLLASAIELGCGHFLSEDLRDGQVIEDGDGRRLTIVDPFAHSPGQILLPR